MTPDMVNEIVRRAVNIATSAAMRGHPYQSVHWIPPTTATQDWRGAFAVTLCGPRSASLPDPWENQV